MKKILLFLGLAFAAESYSQVFSENFNNGIPATWTIIDNDGLSVSTHPNVSQFTDAWIGADDLFTNPGDTVAMSTSWYDPPGQSDDWLITPGITLTANNILSWDEMAEDPNFPDGYEVRISTTTPTIAEFLGNAPLYSVAAAPTTWTNQSINLDIAGYSNQTVYIAWRNNSTDEYILKIDDISIFEVQPYDAEMTYGDTTAQYTQIPLDHVAGPFGSQGTISSVGLNDVTGATMTVNVYDGAMTQVYTETSAAQNIPVGTMADFTVAGYTPSAVDVYTVEYICGIIELDSNAVNDTTYQVFAVTDSTYARDDATIAGSIGFEAGSTGILGNNYDLVIDDTMSTVSFYSFPTIGDTTKVTIYSTVAEVPTTVVGGSNEYIFTAADTSSQGMMITLPVWDLSGNPLSLTAGEYYVGIEEYNSTSSMSLSQSLDILTYNKVWFSINGGAFSTLESVGLPGSFIVRPNFGTVTPQTQGLNDIADANGLEVYPNPSAGTFNVAINGLYTEDLTIEVTSVNGQVILSNEYGNVAGFTTAVLELNAEAGTYFVRLTADGESVTKRIVVQK